MIVMGEPPTERVLDPTTTTPDLPDTVWAASVVDPAVMRMAPVVGLALAKGIVVDPTTTPLEAALMT